MSDSLEAGGRVLGDLVGRGQAALQQGAVYGAGGAAAGAVGGGVIGTAGVVTGPGEVAIEPAAIATGAVVGGGLGAAYGAAKGLVQGTPGFADQGAELGRRFSHLITQMTSAQARAQTRVKDALDKACATCGCSALANGIPSAPYRGGAHVFMQESGREPAVQSHHMPPNAVSPLPKDMGPAIQMDTKDHYATPSFGQKVFSPFMKSQGNLANKGQFMTAFAVDAAAVEEKYPGKYTSAIAQALAYAKCLQNAGLIK